jgi:hypothetical protein
MSKIIWTESKTLALTGSVYIRKLSGGYYESPAERDMDLVHEWVRETGIGKRTSFDTFKFRSRADMSLFLLHWNAGVHQ